VPQHLELRNELLRVTVATAEGGRIASLCSLRSSVEFLFQSQHPFAPVQAGRHASFQQGACAGIEECLPTVSACKVDGEIIPDHGDFWQLAWNVVPASDPNSLTISADGFSQPLRFTKKILLRGACLRMEYRIENTSTRPAPFLYATHPLLAIEPGDHILLPKEVASLALHSSRHNRLGCAGYRVAWPVSAAESGEEQIDSSRILEPTAGTADMLYSDRFKSGWCGLYRAQQKQGIVVRFDTAVLPYLGLWICCGGWPEEGSGPKQYAFAPEPTTAPCGSLEEALDRGLAISLLPQSSFEFAIEFCVAPCEVTLEEFSHFASGK